MNGSSKKMMFDDASKPPAQSEESTGTASAIPDQQNLPKKSQETALAKKSTTVLMNSTTRSSGGPGKSAFPKNHDYDSPIAHNPTNASNVAQQKLEKYVIPWLREQTTELFLFCLENYKKQRRGGVVFIFNSVAEIRDAQTKMSTDQADWKYMARSAVECLQMKTNHILSALQ